MALAPEVLESVACKREPDYAADLCRRILPVLLVATRVSTYLLPPLLADIDFIDRPELQDEHNR